MTCCSYSRREIARQLQRGNLLTRSELTLPRNVNSDHTAEPASPDAPIKPAPGPAAGSAR